MADHNKGDLRIVNKPGHWAHGQRVEVVDAGQASAIGSRSPRVEVKFPDSLGHGSEYFGDAELLPLEPAL
jgi:hypothetical protein